MYNHHAHTYTPISVRTYVHTRIYRSASNLVGSYLHCGGRSFGVIEVLEQSRPRLTSLSCQVKPLRPRACMDTGVRPPTGSEEASHLAGNAREDTYNCCCHLGWAAHRRYPWLCSLWAPGWAGCRRLGSFTPVRNRCARRNVLPVDRATLNGQARSS